MLELAWQVTQEPRGGPGGSRETTECRQVSLTP